jgi:hypothetical protein
MTSNKFQFILAVGLVVCVYGALLLQYATQQPAHSGGPFVLLWISLLTAAVTGVVIGKVVSHRTGTQNQVKIGMLQLIVAVLLFVPVTLIIYSFDTNYVELSVLRSWYGALFGLSGAIIIISNVLSYVLHEVLTTQSEPV